MSKYLIISKENAEIIKGRYGKYSNISPVPLPDGMFAVPESCLTDEDLVNVDKILLKMAVETKEIQFVTEDVKEVQKDMYYVIEAKDDEDSEQIIKCVSTLDISKMDVKTIDYNTDRHFLTFNDKTSIIGKTLNFFGV